MSNQDQVKELAEELIKKMNYPAEVSVAEDSEAEAINVKITTDDPGVLIGFHGKTLSSFQLILGLMIFRKLGQWQRLIVDVNDYRQEQAERLKNIALNTAERVELSGKPAALSPMAPYERRQIHLALADSNKVETTSEGEGQMRHVIIFPKNSSVQKPSEPEEEPVN